VAGTIATAIPRSQRELSSRSARLLCVAARNADCIASHCLAAPSALAPSATSGLPTRSQAHYGGASCDQSIEPTPPRSPRPGAASRCACTCANVRVCMQLQPCAPLAWRPLVAHSCVLAAPAARCGARQPSRSLRAAAPAAQKCHTSQRLSMRVACLKGLCMQSTMVVDTLCVRHGLQLIINA
jgi:hypothetical protein